MRQLINIQEIEEALEQYGDIVVSKKNKDNVVVMSMEEYKNKLLNERIEKHLLKSEEDIENGKTRKAVDVIKELRLKYGF